MDPVARPIQHLPTCKSAEWLGDRILTLSQDEPIIHRWGPTQSEPEWSIELEATDPEELFAFPDASGFLCRTKSGALVAYAADGAIHHKIKKEDCLQASLSPDGAIVYALQGPSRLCAWSLPEQRELFSRELTLPAQQIVAARGGVLVCDAQHYYLISQQDQELFASPALAHYGTERPVYSLHHVALDGDDAFGVWSWGRSEGLRGYALRRWNVLTGVIVWSKRLWQNFRLALSANYVAVYYENDITLHDKGTGQRLGHLPPKASVERVVASTHQDLFLVAEGANGAAVYDCADFAAVKIEPLPADEGWVASFFAAPTPEEKRDIFYSFWDSISFDWKQALANAYPPLRNTASPRKLLLGGTPPWLIEGFLRDELQVYICGQRVEVPGVQDMWANPEGYPDYENEFHSNDTLEPLRFLQNVILLDCSISRVTSLEPVRGLKRLQHINTRECNITSK